MNILVFSALYPPYVGGVGRYVKNVSYTLKKMGHDVTIVTSALYNNAGRTNEEGIMVYRLPCFCLLNGRFPVIRKNRKFCQIQKELKRNQYDFCMIHTRFYSLSLYAAYFSYKLHIKSFVLDHGSAHLSFGNPILDFFENIYEHTITELVKRYCHCFYGVSHESELFLKHFHIKSKGVLHNAVDVEEIEHIIQDTEFRVDGLEKLPKDCILISYIGRLIYRKGVLELNEAILQLIEQYPQLYLVYAGDGELRTRLEKQRSSHTILLGELEYQDAIKLMEKSDIFCLPSETEGFPTSVLEAAACKTFIITTTAGGSKELVKNENFGIIMKDNNPITIKHAIEKALNIEYRKEAVRNCFREVKENYSWNQIAERIIMENE